MMTEVSGTRTMPANADQRIRSHVAGVRGHQEVGYLAHGAAEHTPDEQRRSENASGIPRGIAGGSGDQLEAHQQRHGAEQQVAVQSLAENAITNAQYVGREPAEKPHVEAAGDRLQPTGGHWEREEPFALP